MRIYVDITEPGALIQKLRLHAERAGIPVERSVLHKREGSGSALTATHPFYGHGCDFVISDDTNVAVCVIERKTLDDLSRSVSVGQETDAPRLFRQLQELARHPLPILILEGQPSHLYRRLEASIMGFQFWCARQGVAIMYTTSLESTAKAVHLMARKLAISYDAPGVNDLASFMRHSEAPPAGGQRDETAGPPRQGSA